MKYENNWESLNSRPVPSWFEDAKLGIFIHWGLYSVPAYAPFGDYAEWYGWPIGMTEEPTGSQPQYIEYHKKHYGENFKYSDFVSGFTAEHFDANEWAELFAKSGAKYMNLVSKHHDGFCLFDTKYTDHNVMNTPFGKDIVRLLSESCKKYGLKLGIYLSPWDRHEKTYGTEEYNNFFVNQLTELCENYGEIFTFWFDGACGEGPNGKKQVYDWERYYSTIRHYHPDAVITICGPDVRWIGNEGGNVRESEWSVIPSEKDSNNLVMENSQTDASQVREMAEKLNDTSSDLGSRAILEGYRNLVFKPAEADLSITYGWFYHESLYYFPRPKRTA